MMTEPVVLNTWRPQAQRARSVGDSVPAHLPLVHQPATAVPTSIGTYNTLDPRTELTAGHDDIQAY